MLINMDQPADKEKRNFEVIIDDTQHQSFQLKNTVNKLLTAHLIALKNVRIIKEDVHHFLTKVLSHNHPIVILFYLCEDLECVLSYYGYTVVFFTLGIVFLVH